jgi:enamine deaminase RidA (YjgF/YER057c/UK114 family)
MGHGGVEELHLTLTPTADADRETQWRWLRHAYAEACAAQGLAGSAVFVRVFHDEQPDTAFDPGCPVSWVYQPPLPPAHVALWAYHLRTPDGATTTRRDGAWVAVERPAHTHLWTTGLTAPGDTSAEQTTGIFTAYTGGLQARGLTLADGAVRTWLFVRDVDANYGDLVTARRAHFTAHGLTAETHYIASTGIEGLAPDNPAFVQMDAYAVAGLRPEQVTYLSATGYLCPTHHYGVTFERGTAVRYADRTQIYISGTASIDRDGQIVHPGDLQGQIARTLENIAALLRQAGAGPRDVAQYLVYLRNADDRAVAARALRAHLGDVPAVIVRGPVCRPGWLIEIECIALRAADDDTLPPF